MMTVSGQGTHTPPSPMGCPVMLLGKTLSTGIHVVIVLFKHYYRLVTPVTAAAIHDGCGHQIPSELLTGAYYMVLWSWNYKHQEDQ